MNDDQLAELLRAALPPARDEGRRTDPWPAIVDRLDAAPRWSRVDLGLAAAAIAVLLMNPEWLWLIAYHL